MRLIITFAHSVDCHGDLRDRFLLRPHFGDFLVGEWPVGRPLALCGRAPFFGVFDALVMLLLVVSNRGTAWRGSALLVGERPIGFSV